MCVSVCVCLLECRYARATRRDSSAVKAHNASKVRFDGGTDGVVGTSGTATSRSDRMEGGEEFHGSARGHLGVARRAQRIRRRRVEEGADGSGAESEETACGEDCEMCRQEEEQEHELSYLSCSPVVIVNARHEVGGSVRGGEPGVGVSFMSEHTRASGGGFLGMGLLPHTRQKCAQPNSPYSMSPSTRGSNVLAHLASSAAAAASAPHTSAAATGSFSGEGSPGNTGSRSPAASHSSRRASELHNSSTADMMKGFRSYSASPSSISSKLRSSALHLESPPAIKLGLEIPRVAVVSRGFIRKNKLVDFVGSYHSELLVQFGACPLIVPRVAGVQALLDAYEPLSGVLLIEGQDIDPELCNPSGQLPEQGAQMDSETLARVKQLHSDTQIDRGKDNIEFELVRRCMARGIPFLGICRGCQVLNVVNGGTLYADVETELGALNPETSTKHIDYSANYDLHRHPVALVPGTPLTEWFQVDTLLVNSYHHQGVQKLAPRFVPMAHAPDGLIEAFYDPLEYDPKNGKFCVGLQFHPERLRFANSGEFEHEGCPRVYESFVEACKAYCFKEAERVRRDIEMDKMRYLVRHLSVWDRAQVVTRSQASPAHPLIVSQQQQQQQPKQHQSDREHQSLSMSMPKYNTSSGFLNRYNPRPPDSETG
ncbi:Protein NtpR [Porphyridium purpureum]|uniref:Protein NtpR n=1 Tax=Porphyridium purpureum TaxID=35688 RepID=A0A5J4Z5J5_PORPP|nr:Protein NtpR [Porphyridium purpureum]|eukprot:POR6716..scf295_1